MIEFLADITNNKLLKVTLSEQTDIIDLLGSDMPCNDEEAN
jgi:midasin (ATPase involved in ribosome maturation)